MSGRISRSRAEGRIARWSIASTAAALALAALLSGSRAALADDPVYMHCTFSGESVRDPPVTGAVHDESEKLLFGEGEFGLWSDTIDFEVEPNSSRVLMRWHGKTIPARLLFPFMPSRILVETSEADVKREWWFHFDRLSFSGSFFDFVTGKVDALKTSVRMPQAEVSFHGDGYCAVAKECSADAVPNRCSDKHFCLDRAKMCGVFRYDN
jgi:hypothetical protein